MNHPVPFRLLRNQGVTAPRGFLASAVKSGIKPGKKDLVLVFSEQPAQAAAVFTTNAVKAAPVLISRSHVQGGLAQAIVANSGCANCCTGKAGLRNAMALVAAVADELSVPQQCVLTASTGMIGPQLPVEKMLPRVGSLVRALSADGGTDAAEGIMTTDTTRKQAAVRYREGGATVTVGGICKGAGMICPNMATMFCFLTTDAAIDSALLQEALSDAVAKTFNRINIDGDMSTNDTVFALANGMSQAPRITTRNAAYHRLQQAIEQLCNLFSCMIVADAEGATKTIAIEVRRASTHLLADRVARKISNSNLFKSAVYGANPNWGRIMAALGGVDPSIDPSVITLWLCGKKVFEHGEPCRTDARRMIALMSAKHIDVVVDLGSGQHGKCVLTCDLTPEYVHINQ